MSSYRNDSIKVDLFWSKLEQINSFYCVDSIVWITGPGHWSEVFCFRSWQEISNSRLRRWRNQLFFECWLSKWTSPPQRHIHSLGTKLQFSGSCPLCRKSRSLTRLDHRGGFHKPPEKKWLLSKLEFEFPLFFLFILKGNDNANACINISFWLVC